jgi:dynein heavy chain
MSRYMPDREFNPERIKNVSTACEGLCKWVRAMEVYDRVIKIVAPKKAALAEAEAELAAQMDTLNEKRAQLQEVTDKLQALNDEFAAETKKKKELEDQIEICSQKLDRAEKLIGGLGGEKSRWSQTAKDLHGLLGNVIGDVILSSGTVAYLGAFTVDYRNALIKNWNAFLFESGDSVLQAVFVGGHHGGSAGYQDLEYSRVACRHLQHREWDNSDESETLAFDD